LDTADAVVEEVLVLSGNVDVSLVSPTSSPGVSDDVVVVAAIVSIADTGDSVVEGGSASRAVNNTALVALED